MASNQEALHADPDRSWSETELPARERLARFAEALEGGAPLLIVVNGGCELYPDVLERAGLRLGNRYRRRVNRRTGMRAGEYFEHVLVARSV